MKKENVNPNIIVNIKNIEIFLLIFLLESIGNEKNGWNNVVDIKIKIKSNNTFLIIGEIINIYIDNSLIEDDGTLNLEKCDSLSVGGLNTYYKLKQVSQFPYARVENLPDFT